MSAGAGAIPDLAGASLASDHPIAECCETLGLSPTETAALTTLAAFELDPRVRQLVSALSGDGPSSTLGALLGIVYPGDPQRWTQELSERGALLTNALIEIDPLDLSRPMSARRVRAVDRVIALAAGVVELDPALRHLMQYSEVTAAKVAELVAAPEVRDRIRTSITQGADAFVVLEGGPGGGRRSLLAGAAAAMGYDVCEIDARAFAREPQDAANQLRAIARECRLLRAVPLFRDIDVLDDGSDRLGLLESLFSTGLVLATCTRTISRRWNRPPVCIVMPTLTHEQRIELWQRALPVATEADAGLLATLYPIAPSFVLAVGEAARSLAGTTSMRPEHLEAALRSVLDQKLAGLATRVTVTQTWDDVVLSEDQAVAITELMARIRQRDKVHYDWGFAEKVGSGLGITALFSGPPGTGKTMMAGVIARALRVEVFRVDVSKIVSKWIGETEKHLAQLFDAAEAGHAVLLFDEADSMFGKRTDVRTSTDRYANQEINFLLQRIESFRGICILTTNHESAMDEAFRRRLTVHVRFPLPSESERRRLWQALIPKRAPVEAELGLDNLAKQFVMSGGYVKNAVMRAAFLAADAGSPINAAHLARAAQLEYEAMGKLTSR